MSVFYILQGTTRSGSKEVRGVYKERKVAEQDQDFIRERYGATTDIQEMPDTDGEYYRVCQLHCWDWGWSDADLTPEAWADMA